jgi:hypothetical protein
MADGSPWTIIGSTAIAVAIGTTGILLGREDDGGALRDPISLADPVPIEAAGSRDDDDGPGIKVIPPKSWFADGANDSPNHIGLNGSPDVFPQAAPSQQAAPAALDSPDNSPAVAPQPAAPAAADSPDLASFDSPDGSV